MVHKTITAPRGTSHYRVKGSSGQSTVCSHGATMDRDMFHHQGMRHPHRYLSRMIAKGIALDTQVQAYVLDVLPSYATAEIAAIMDGIYKGIVPGDPNQRIECPAVMIYGEKNNTGKVRNTVTAGQHARDGKSG